MMVEDNIKRVKLPIEATKPSHSHKDVEPVLSKCSCPECDSLKCFILRRSPDNKSCNCPKKSKSTCNNAETVAIKPKLDINRVISQVNKTVDICTKISHHKIFNSEKGTVDTIIQSTISCKSIIQESDTSQDSLRDVNLTMPPIRNFSENTAHLSAQIINAGCIQDFSDCISINEPYKEDVAEVNNMKEYIYRKIKEIYNACSCKVCECIPTSPFSTRKSTCSCKPCQCDDCHKLYRYIGGHLKEKPHVGCPCISCDRKDCQGVVKTSKKTCNCKPCDCLMCTESVSKNCNCTPCACLECKYKSSYLKRSFIVAAVGHNNQSTTCNCESPCECPNCIPTYGTTSVSQERSTGTVTRGFCPCNSCTNQSCQSNGENCRCEMQKHVMSKPIDRGHHDYDIHNVLLQDTELLKNYNRDVISMCASVQQQLGMGDDPSQFIQRENRFATQYIQLSLPNKVCQYRYDINSIENKTSSCCYNTGDGLEHEEIKPLCDTGDIPHLQNVIISHCDCDFCKRQRFDGVRMENKNNEVPKEQSNLLVIASITHSVCESNQNMKDCQLKASKGSMNNSKIQLNPFSTVSNSKNTIRVKDKVHRKNTELLTKHNKLYCTASILINFLSSKSLSEDNKEYSSSLNTLLPVTPDPVTSTLNDVHEKLDLEERSVKENYFRRSSAIPFFDKIYDENQTNNINNVPKRSVNTFDYAKVQKTLLQAQEFSIKLRGILEHYEAANSNFRSVSQRLKQLYRSIVRNTTSDNKTHKVHFNHNKDTNQLYYVGDRVSVTNDTDLSIYNINSSVTTSQSSNSNKTSLKPILGSHNLLENVQSLGFINDEDFFGDVIPKCSSRLDYDAYKIINNALITYKRQKSPSNISKQSNIVSNKKNNKYAETDFLYFNPNKLNKSTCMQINAGQHDEKLNTEITFRDADFYKDENTETNILENLYSKLGDIIIPSTTKLKNHEEAKNLHWNILRKNIFLETDVKRYQNSDISHLEANIKDIIRIISQEIRKELFEHDSRYNQIYQEKKIYQSIRTILDRVVSIVVLKSEINAAQSTALLSTYNLNLKKTCFNHESRKASFTDIKRISDHTVIVKWSIPNEMSNILGYELQVDGRSFKKIYSPHCAMAVINSLPQSERVLLTILTITDSDGPYSSNTIIYNPNSNER